MKKSVLEYFSFVNIISVIILFIFLAILYKQYELKQYRMNSMNGSPQNQFDIIKKYLLRDPKDYENSLKPILWIHIPFEYNSRNWTSFGSRSNYQLNQPYLYLTVKSIVDKCDQSFTICMIDDSSFDKLIPNWQINMNKVSAPISDNLRQLALAKIIHEYGGMICPISFLCMRDLIGMYQTGTSMNRPFICENIDRNSTSTHLDFFPDLSFFGAERNCPVVKQLIEFIQYTISTDYTAQSIFLGDFNRWCNEKISQNKLVLIDAELIGTKNTDGRAIPIDDLLAQNYIKLSGQAYGIYVPAKEILNRTKFEWFARLSQKQVLSSNTILGNYILITVGPYTTAAEGGSMEGMSGMPSDGENGKEQKIATLAPVKYRPGFVSFWKTPLVSNFGLKPNFLGDNIRQQSYPIS